MHLRRCFNFMDGVEERRSGQVTKQLLLKNGLFRMEDERLLCSPCNAYDGFTPADCMRIGISRLAYIKARRTHEATANVRVFGPTTMPQ